MAIEFKELDVREMLATGIEPFPAIMSATDELRPGQGLLLIAPFQPKPLYSVMERKGFRHEVTALDTGDFEVRFRPVAAEIVTSSNVSEDDDWPEPSRSFDLTELEPPQPMVRILGELETMGAGEVLFVVLAREPVFLFPELTRRGHKWAGNYDKSGEAFRLLIKRGMEPK
ncbi:DUF2249 domain-containing protein [Rhizobium alvei]|uniref:DUF2249 domain-containing protein n=1 Tax=Rhizobium alvei TaxID=1132659 RepID=A0ABT8YU21_9HYPH|nr:DUF2249 domain-containing protein [Rhizobium alvei]MDO6966887.1 DUF2249 domain-containing protein [Rhizobium alvei]